MAHRCRFWKGLGGLGLRLHLVGVGCTQVRPGYGARGAWQLLQGRDRWLPPLHARGELGG